jgi:pyruvate formate lyase activating enzyme
MEPGASIDRHTAVGKLWKQEDAMHIRCVACAHRCLLARGRRGICKVRFNQDGQLRVPSGYVSGIASDPVEKKPFFHVLPGSQALTFGMLGCNFHCDFCQNWFTSQTLRDAAASLEIQPVTAGAVVSAALRSGARILVSSYNEPVITSEWAAEIFAPAKDAGLLCAMVSNGHATPETLDFLAPWLSAFKIDLKCFDAQRYRSLGGTLEAVMECIRMVRQRNIWLEIVTLLVPGFNDTEAELRSLTRFIASVSPDIPWHVTAFRPMYHRTIAPATTAAQLLRAAETGLAEGLRFVYAGNIPGRVDRLEDTHCPQCHVALVERHGFSVGRNLLDPAGRCPSCHTPIPGIWAAT